MHMVGGDDWVASQEQERGSRQRTSSVRNPLEPCECMQASPECQVDLEATCASHASSRGLTLSFATVANPRAPRCCVPDHRPSSTRFLLSLLVGSGHYRFLRDSPP